MSSRDVIALNQRVKDLESELDVFKNLLSSSNVLQTFVGTIKEMVESVQKKQKTISELRGKLGNSSQNLVDAYLEFAVLLGTEIGKTQKMKPDDLDIRIMLDGKIVISSGKIFHIEFTSYNKMLEYLLCMVRVLAIQDGSDIVNGIKTIEEVYKGMEDFAHSLPDDPESSKGIPMNCQSCGKPLPPVDENDPDVPIIPLCENCYQDGET